jgi:endonuclease YncB( thermonuclease family)
MAWNKSSRQRSTWRGLRNAITIACVIMAAGFALEVLGVTAITPGRYAVVDGDSLRRGATDIRLYGIDAPELNQTCNDGQGAEYKCGREAANALKELVQGKTLKCRARDKDRYQRIVAVCAVDNLEINREMVRLGWAIAYERHSFGYVLAERDARKNQRGMWYGDFENPQDYRQRHRTTKGDVSGAESDEDE